MFCFDRSVVTLHRRASITPPSPPLDFLLSISVFAEPSLRELLRISYLIICKKLNKEYDKENADQEYKIRERERWCN